MVAPIELFVVPHAEAWRDWLIEHEDDSDGVWLALAKKGTTDPTTLVYDQALEEALCSGWIDGQKRGWDDAVFAQRFTPRRKASLWSTRNVGIVAALVADERMRPRGQAEIDRAKADGRWDRAYDGAKTAEVPEDLTAALAASPAAAARFAELNRHEPVRGHPPHGDGSERRGAGEPPREAGRPPGVRRSTLPAVAERTRA